MGELWWVLPSVALLGLLMWAGHKTLMAGGQGGGAADALGGLIDVFDPGQARSAREIKRHHDAGPVTPSPDDDDDDDPVRLLRNPDGSPRAIRLRRAPREP